jgi:flagellar assembly protein FliH
MEQLVTHQKFSFDTVFDDAGAIAFAPARTKRSYTADEVEAVRRDAFAEGQASTVAAAQRDIAAAVDRIAALSEGALSALANVAHDHRVCSAELAMAAARKIADAALERFPQAPIAAAMVELAREIEAQPKLMARVAPNLVEDVQAALERAAQAIGFGGQIIAHADDALPEAAFLLDWGEGRATFDPQAAAARVAEALDTALAAEGLHAEPLLPPSEHVNEADHG